METLTESLEQQSFTRDKPRAQSRTYPSPRLSKPPGGPTVAEVERSQRESFDHRFTTARSSASISRADYVARAIEARRLAEAATDRSIELIHREMALRYDLLARLDLDEEQPLHGIG